MLNSMDWLVDQPLKGATSCGLGVLRIELTKVVPSVFSPWKPAGSSPATRSTRLVPLRSIVNLLDVDILEDLGKLVDRVE
jgi:hypothetical protein